MTDTAMASQATDRAGAHTSAQARARASYQRLSLFAILGATITMALGASAHAGVNLANNAKPPGYSQPLTVYQRNGKIYAAWAVGSNGSLNAGAFEIGFYVRGQRQLVATLRNGLPRGYMSYGTDAPLNLPDGESLVELKINDTRWQREDSYGDNNLAIRVTVNRGGGGGIPPTALTRAQAGYKFPSTLGNSSASRIISRMNDMFSVQWVPSADFTNWRMSGNTGYYTKGTRFYGLPYSQANPQTDVTGFTGHLPAIKGTLNSTTGVGPDCSGSISIAMELPSRHTTLSFDQPSSHFWTVVQPGTMVRNASKIQAGDVISSSSWGHCVLVLSSPVNGKVSVLESTADQGINANGSAQRWAVVKNTRSLSDLDRQNCRVIRRNKLN